MDAVRGDVGLSHVWGVIFVFLPLCIYFCRVRSIEVLTGVLTAASSFFFVVHRHPIFGERPHRSASTAMVPLGCLHFLHIMNVVWSQTCTRNRTVFGTATAHHGAATTGEKESVKVPFWRCTNERLGLASASQNMERSRRTHVS